MVWRKRALKRYELRAQEDIGALISELEDRIRAGEGFERIREPLLKPSFDQLYRIIRKRLMDKENPGVDEKERALLSRRTKLANYARVYIRAEGIPTETPLGIIDKEQAFQLFQGQYEKFISQYKDPSKENVPSGILRQVVQIKYNRMVVNYYEPRAPEAFERIAKMLEITKPFEPPAVKDPDKFKELYAKWKNFLYVYHSFALDALFNVRIKLVHERLYQLTGTRNKISYSRLLRWRKPSLVGCGAFLTVFELFIAFCQVTVYGKEDLERREAVHKKFRDILGPYNKYIFRYLKAGEKMGHINGWMAQHLREPNLTRYVENFLVMEAGTLED